MKFQRFVTILHKMLNTKTARSLSEVM